MKERFIKLWNEYFVKYRKYGSMVGYPLFYSFCLMVFASLTFPYDKLKERIVVSFNAEQRASGGQQELQVDSVSGYWLTGLRMTGVTILTAPSEAGKPPSKLTVDDAEIRYSILPMLVGNSELTFDVHAFGGEVTGSFGQHGKDKSVDVAIDAIDLGKMQPLSALIGVPIEGKLTGVVRLSMPEGKASKGSGQLSLESTGTAVGDGKAKLKGAVALPRLDIGTVTIGADAKDGVMKITKYTAGGKDLDLQGDGRITLREQFTDSLGDMQVRFRINDAYRSKNDLTKSLFGVPGSNAPALFELADPKIKQSKRTDGSYAWTVRGPLSKLEFVPAAR